MKVKTSKRVKRLASAAQGRSEEPLSEEFTVSVRPRGVTVELEPREQTTKTYRRAGKISGPIMKRR